MQMTSKKPHTAVVAIAATLAIAALSIFGACMTLPEQRIITFAPKLPQTDAPLQLKTDCTLGDAVKLALETNPSTGYTWTLTTDNPTVAVLETRELQTYKNGACGSPTHETFLLRCVNRGTANIQMQYLRPWERHPIKRIEIKINVK